MNTELYLIRHCPLDVVPGTLVGSTDFPLSELSGTDENFAQIDRHLEGMDVWFCSPLLRCRQTLEVLQQQFDIGRDVSYDERLREIDFGQWEMQSFAEINTAAPEYIEPWSRYTDFVFPGGEAVCDFYERVGDVLELFKIHDAEKIAVITHGGVIRTMICLALGISVRNYLLFDVQPASLTVLELFSQGGILKGLNI